MRYWDVIFINLNIFSVRNSVSNTSNFLSLVSHKIYLTLTEFILLQSTLKFTKINQTVKEFWILLICQFWLFTHKKMMHSIASKYLNGEIYTKPEEAIPPRFIYNLKNGLTNILLSEVCNIWSDNQIYFKRNDCIVNMYQQKHCLFFFNFKFCLKRAHHNFMYSSSRYKQMWIIVWTLLCSVFLPICCSLHLFPMCFLPTIPPLFCLTIKIVHNCFLSHTTRTPEHIEC